jgi:phosphate transport system protein
MAPSKEHTVKAFDEDLRQIRSLLSRMGGLAEDQIASAVDALTRRDVDAALQVVSKDAQIDALDAEAERLAVMLIAKRAPMADDLREIIAALKICAAIERIGDYAKNIAKRTSVLAKGEAIEPLVIVPEMARVVRKMVRDALDAYLDRDAELARRVCERDTSVDNFYNSLFRSLLTYMMENPHHITPSAHLLFIAKNLERIGDHATNIAESVHFSATGELLHARPKSDDTAYVASTTGGAGA